jgi:hypothetical protein
MCHAIDQHGLPAGLPLFLGENHQGGLPFGLPGLPHYILFYYLGLPSPGISGLPGLPLYMVSPHF